MTRRMIRVAAALALSVSSLALGSAVVRAEGQPEVNMLHQWSEGSDAAAIAKLGEMFEAEGGKWSQTAIPGHTANTIAKLRADVVAGNAPAAVQLKGPEIAEWETTGKTANVDDVAAAGKWSEVVAPELIGVMKPNEHWIAAPMNIHRINWMWASKPALDKAGVAGMPRTWAEFNAAAEKLKAAGLIPIAHGSQDWIDATVFETVLYGMDVDTYRKAFVELDLDAIRGEGMQKALDQFRQMIQWTDPGIPGRAWDAAAAMMLKGEAGFFFMGDWAIGTYNAGGFKEGVDYLCAGAPSDNGKPGFILNADSVIFFEQSKPELIAGQKMLAELIMSPGFQTIFNQAKGSIPARMDIDLANGFNPCQQLSQKDLQGSIEAGTLVLSMAHNMSVLQKYRGAMMEVITEFVNDPSMTSADAAERMAENVEAQM